MATVSDGDRDRMARQATALDSEVIDDEGTPEWRTEMTARLNERRAARGLPPLEDWCATKGELELHERARALGLLDPVR